MPLNNEVVYVHNSGPQDNEIRDYRFYGETYYTSKDYSKGTNTHCISAFNAKPSIACKVDTGDEKSKTIGKAHRILSGHYQSDEALVQFRNFLQTEQRAEFSNFYDSGDSQFQAASSVGQFTNFLDFAEDTVLRKTNNTFFPVRVRCIHREKFGEQSGDLKIPFFYQASQGSILNIKDGTLTLPMNIQFMQVRLTYSPDNNVYQIRLPRLEGDDQVSFQNLLVEQEVEKTKCVFSPNPDRCREFVETMHEIETLTDPNSEGSSIYSNEIVFKLEELSFGFGFSRAETKIPACEEASEAI